MPQLILASSSKPRMELMDSLNVVYSIVPSNYEEDMTLPLEIRELAMTLARGKALDVTNRVSEGIVIGVDTFVGFNGYRIGKPKDETVARQTLEQLSGNTHQVYSGVSLIDAKTRTEWAGHCVTNITFKRLTAGEIDDYIATGEPMKRAGAYALQGEGAKFIEKVDGCKYNVMGLPLPKLAEGLRTFGVEIKLP